MVAESFMPQRRLRRASAATASGVSQMCLSGTLDAIRMLSAGVPKPHRAVAPVVSAGLEPRHRAQAYAAELSWAMLQLPYAFDGLARLVHCRPPRYGRSMGMYMYRSQ